MDEKIILELISILNGMPTQTVSDIHSCLEKNFNLDHVTIGRKILSDIGSAITVQEFRNFLLSNQKIPLNEISNFMTAFQIMNQEKKDEKIELVWSGPGLSNIPIRLTEQVILDLIKNAKESLFIASFAVYKARNVMNEMEKAIDKGVKLTFLLETPESSHHKININPIDVIPKKIIQNSKILIWTYNNRKIDGDDQIGTLHGKFIIQDDQRAFISSANLTESAFERNIELGVLIKERNLVKLLRSHIAELIKENVFSYL